MSAHFTIVTEYAEKLDEFYKKKKSEFKQANEAKKELNEKYQYARERIGSTDI